MRQLVKRGFVAPRVLAASLLAGFFVLSGGASPWYVPLLSQLHMKALPISSTQSARWVISGSAKPFLLTALNIPEAFKHIDLFEFKVTMPRPLMELLSGGKELHRGDVFEIHHIQVHQKNLRIKARGKLQVGEEKDFTGQLEIEGTGVIAHVEALVQSGALRPSVGSTLQFLLTGLNLSQGDGKVRGGEGAPSVPDRPVHLVLVAKDKMLWLQGIPLCPLDQLFSARPQEKP